MIRRHGGAGVTGSRANAPEMEMPRRYGFDLRQVWPGDFANQRPEGIAGGSLAGNDSSERLVEKLVEMPRAGRLRCFGDLGHRPPADLPPAGSTSRWLPCAVPVGRRAHPDGAPSMWVRRDALQRGMAPHQADGRPCRQAIRLASIPPLARSAARSDMQPGTTHGRRRSFGRQRIEVSHVEKDASRQCRRRDIYRAIGVIAVAGCDGTAVAQGSLAGSRGNPGGATAGGRGPAPARPAAPPPRPRLAWRWDEHHRSRV